jgi:uncharacterized protein YbbC (DUF1343 family)
MKNHVITGLENLMADPPACLETGRIGLLANPASIARDFTHASRLIHNRFPGRLTALFSPQHGFYAERQDNMIESDHFFEPEFGIPVFSLYSDTRVPTREMFDLIDTLIIDLQDVGTRVYTFIYTVSHCLEAAARFKKKVVILDRPNPIGGIQVEGNILSKEYTSFVGRFPIPMRHGMTIGEISQFFNKEFSIGCDLQIVPMKGWKRKMYWQDTGLVWIAPSPNLPTALSCMVYPGQVVFEGTNISEGRGTTMPFEQFGAPFLDIEKISSRAVPLIQGAYLRQVNFEPTSGKWQGKRCRGFHIHVTSREKFCPYFSSLVLLQAIMEFHKNDFKLRQPPYEYEFHRMPIDLILGSKSLRCVLERNEDLIRVRESWQEGLHKFKQTAKKYYLYD